MKISLVWLAALAGAALAPALADAAQDGEGHGRNGFVAVGALEPGDVDHFDVRLRAGEVLTASLRDADGGELHDPVLGVFAPGCRLRSPSARCAGRNEVGPRCAIDPCPGTLIAEDDDGGPGFLPRLALRAGESGVFRVAVSGFGDDDFDGVGHEESLRYRLVVAVESDPPKLVEREEGARGRSTDALRLRRGAAVVSGRLAPGDADVFEIWLDADAQLTASVFESEAGEFHDPVLRLRDSRGGLLAENDDAGPGFLANLAFDARGEGRGRRPVPVLLELTGFDPDAAGAATHVEDFVYQLVISVDHLE